MTALRYILAFTLASTAFAQSPSDANKTDANKKLLFDFFHLGQDLDARTKMLSPDYVQHNPRFLKMDEDTGKTGKDAWAAAIRAAREHARLTDPDFNLRSPTVAVVAEGDLVIAVFKTTLRDPDDPTKTYEAFNFEMVRFKDGKLAEHWDDLKLSKGWKTELEKKGN